MNVFFTSKRMVRSGLEGGVAEDVDCVHGDPSSECITGVLLHGASTCLRWRRPLGRIGAPRIAAAASAAPAAATRVAAASMERAARAAAAAARAAAAAAEAAAAAVVIFGQFAAGAMPLQGEMTEVRSQILEPDPSLTPREV